MERPINTMCTMFVYGNFVHSIYTNCKLAVAFGDSFTFVVKDGLRYKGCHCVCLCVKRSE